MGWKIIEKKNFFFFFFFVFSHPGGSVSLPRVRESGCISGRLPDDPGGFTCMLCVYLNLQTVARYLGYKSTEEIKEIMYIIEENAKTFLDREENETSKEENDKNGDSNKRFKIIEGNLDTFLGHEENENSKEENNKKEFLTVNSKDNTFFALPVIIYGFLSMHIGTYVGWSINLWTCYNLKTFHGKTKCA